MLHPSPHPRGAPPIIEVRHLTAGYGGPAAVTDISLNVYPEDFTAVLGPSGAGKTTLLRALIGGASIYSGDILYRGQPLRQARPLAGYVPQLETIDWTFPATVTEAVLMGRTRSSRLFPWFSKEDRKHAFDVMDRLGIADLANRHIRALSGGQQQRVFLARALVSNPEVLLLDEPTAGVDVKTRDDILHLLDELNHQGVAVLMTTHEINAVAAHLPWVVCVNRTLIAEGPPKQVFTTGTLLRTYGAEMPVTEYAGITMVAESPHFFGRRNDGRDVDAGHTIHGHQAGRVNEAQHGHRHSATDAPGGA